MSEHAHHGHTPDLVEAGPATVVAVASAVSAPHQHGYIAEKDAILNRLKRVEGQVRGVQRLVGEEAYCIDIVTQVSAIKSALDRVALALLEDHLSHCVTGAVKSSLESGDPSEADAKVREASAAIARLLKS